MLTAVRHLRESGWLAADEVVVLNTGTGLKYPDLVAVDLPVLAPGAVLYQGLAAQPLLHAGETRGQESGREMYMPATSGKLAATGPSATGGCFP